MIRVRADSSYPIEASLRAGGGDPDTRPVRFIHCNGGTGVSDEIDCAKPRRRHEAKTMANIE